jgi:hypothetical protein
MIKNKIGAYCSTAALSIQLKLNEKKIVKKKIQ